MPDSNARYSVGLVVEGGGTKIAYSAGVLQVMLENKIYFPYSVGISSGSEVLLSYVSRQIDRLRVTSIDAAGQKDAIGWRPLFKEGGLFGLEATNEYIESHAPLDFDALVNSSTDMEIGVYNMESNEVEYFGKEHVDKDMTLIKASCALLLLAKPYKWNNRKYFDAGLVDMISVEQALRAGCEKIVVLSTKERGYRRKPAPKWQLWLAKMIYRDPVIVENLRQRHVNYQKQWDLIDKLEDEGRALVLRPSKDMNITRYTTDPAKLGPWYELGVSETKERLDEIIAFTRDMRENDKAKDGASKSEKTEFCANMVENTLEQV